MHKFDCINKEQWPKLEIKKIRKYPLIQIEKYIYENKNTFRKIVRNCDFDHKWYANLLPRLYARQIAKYETWYRKSRNGKPPLDLPYSIEDIYVNDEIEKEYLKWDTWKNPGSNWRGNKIYKKSNISGEEILEAELDS